MSRRKSAAYEQYVSILRRFTTKLLGVRCIFKIGSNIIMQFTTHTQDMWGQKFMVLPNPRYVDWVNATYNWSFAYNAAAQDKIRKDLLERRDYQP